jgi:hypothetical protein
MDKKTIIVTGGFGLLSLIYSEEAKSQIIPLFPHKLYGYVQDAGSPTRDSTYLEAYWTNGTGDGITGTEDDKRVDRPFPGDADIPPQSQTYGSDIGQTGSYKIEVPSKNTEADTVGLNEGDEFYIIARDNKNGDKHLLSYIQDGDTLHLIKHRIGANDSINLSTPVDLENPVTDVRETGYDEKPALSIYPNPISYGNLNVDLPEWDDIEYIRIFDSRGNLLEYDTRGMKGNTYDLDIGGLKSGMYFISIGKSDGETITGRFVKL